MLGFWVSSFWLDAGETYTYMYPAGAAYLRRADAVARDVEDVVDPSSDPVKPVGISVAAVSREVIALPYRT